jgi:aerobic-type carbon monoxide dehydrogenase small subunit (CoxS/CutS family)
MAETTLTVNGQQRTVPVDSADESVMLLWVLREDLGLTGTKFGCGLAECGACTVHLDGEPIRACITPISQVVNGEITTIEGLANEDGSLHKVQEAWVELGVPQCGYCQSGQIMEAAAFLDSNPQPSDDEIREAMAGHLCRCGTYTRIFNAIKLAATKA